MTLVRFRFLAIALGAIAMVAVPALRANAATISTGVSLPTGSFGGTLSGSGNAVLTGASGTYKVHIPHGFWGHTGHTSVGISASNQTVGLSMSNVNLANSVANGAANISYDNAAPGTPVALNSLTADLNGSGGSNVNYGFNINVDSLVINVGFNVDLDLAVAGTISNVTFTSTGSSPASPYGIAGNLTLTVQGTVNGSLDALGGINLGTIYTLAPTTVTVPTVLPGAMLLTDTTAGAGPYPATMGVNLGASIPLPVTVPLSLPISFSQDLNVPTHGDGFDDLTINNGSMINLNLALGNVSYSLSGQVPVAIVPEPGSIALGAMGLVGLAFVGYRRRKAA